MFELDGYCYVMLVAFVFYLMLKNKELNRIIENKDNELQKQSYSLNVLNRQNISMGREMTSVTMNYDDEIRGLESTIDCLECKIGDLESIINDFENKVIDLNVEIDGLQSSESKLRNEIKDSMLLLEESICNIITEQYVNFKKALYGNNHLNISYEKLFSVMNKLISVTYENTPLSGARTYLYVGDVKYLTHRISEISGQQEIESHRSERFPVFRFKKRLKYQGLLNELDKKHQY